MLKNTILCLLTLLVFSCKTSYTGFNAFKGKSHTILPEKVNSQLKPVEINEPEAVLYATTNESLVLPILEKKLEVHKKLIERASKENIRVSEIESTTKKQSFKEKIINKIVQKQLKKANTSSAQPDGFNNLDKNLKIGLILLAVAIGLSIIGLGGLAGLAGLIGLIFVVIGLINTYN